MGASAWRASGRGVKSLVVDKPGDIDGFARSNEAVRIARIREDAKLPMAERLDQTLRLSKFLGELAEAGGAARERARS